ncbi:methionine--tRNA ligase [Anaplasmataceae bacterium AB001_6]|nr:methionine--tRNA ligase [Anaplasmataceae bacterium AB001_6]
MTAYITTPIYYVNDVPHIGHAYSNLIADILTRYYLLKGEDAFFATGTDEHGQKIEKSAKKQGINPKEYVDKINKYFEDLTKIMKLKNTDYIRTTESRHIKNVNLIWNKLYESGYIYKDSYKGWYAVRDEAFYTESDLIDGKAPTGADVEWIEEENYFFKLSAFQDRLIEHYEKHPNCIFPDSRKNEVLSFIKSGLKDLSISRSSFKWGISVPNDPEHVIYVWIDALTNYLTVAQYAEDSRGKFNEMWNKSKVIHIIGKDILMFHAVYWPAILMACDIKIMDNLLVTGWWTNEGQKISKSLGNVIDPFEIIDNFGLDCFRYFLAREITVGKDGDFSISNLKNRFNSELANNIGNLVQRTTSMIYSKTLNRSVRKNLDNNLLLGEFYKIKGSLENIEQFNFNKTLDDILNLSSKANAYIEDNAPWKLTNDQEKLEKVLYTAMEMIRCIIIAMQIFIPETANSILNFMDIEQRNFDALKINNAKDIYEIKNKPDAFFMRK